jgi:hypothetical protein
MQLFMVDRDIFVLTTANEKTVREFWKNYHAYRYDFNCSFERFLTENGIYARVASPHCTPQGYDLSSITISLN